MYHKIALVVAHEIYGLNDHMKDVIHSFSSPHIDVFCPNFLERPLPFPYEEEQEAYLYFMKNIGFKRGKETIEKAVMALRKDYTHVGIIGFSIGATIAWLCSENKNVDFIICCYGSRIRDYTHITPVCPALLLFPEQEASFSIPSLITHLKQHNPSLNIKQFPGEHGFLNRYHKNYNEGSIKQAYKTIHSFLQHIH